MKFKGTEIKKFWDDLPKGVLHEEGPFEPGADGRLHWVANLQMGADWNDGPAIEDDLIYDVTYGSLYWDGNGPEPKDFTTDLVLAMKRWKKAQTMVTLVVTVPKDQEEEARALFREHKWKVS
jgi:hypothetical protein